jgi:hypothetical protein
MTLGVEEEQGEAHSHSHNSHNNNSQLHAEASTHCLVWCGKDGQRIICPRWTLVTFVWALIHDLKAGNMRWTGRSDAILFVTGTLENEQAEETVRGATMLFAC